MDYYQLIANNFHDTIETITFSVDALAAPIELGTAMMARCLLDDHKIIACGNGADAALAQLFVSNLLSRFEQDRPALPALTLSGDGASMSAIAQTNALHDIYARQLRALGQPGDVLLCISSAAGAANLVRAVQAAHERSMPVIAMCGSQNPELGALLSGEDVELRVEARQPARVVELHTMIIHSFCQFIDHSLFGGQGPE